MVKNDDDQPARNDGDWPTRLGRLFLVVVVLISVILSVKVLQGCTMVVYTASAPTGEDSVNQTTSVEDPDSFFGTSATLGLFRYDPLHVPGGCRPYEFSGSQLDNFAQTARYCGSLAACFGLIALLSIITEFICCRFWCSRFWIVSTLLLACIAQSMTMLIMATSSCLEDNGSSYRCEIDGDSIRSIVASGLYLFSSFWTCLVPRAVPLARTISDWEKNVPRDPCCYCFRNHESDKEIDEVEDDANASSELTVLLDATGSPTGKVHTTVTLADGSKTKQSFDSRAGPTLQDQSIAAYNRWIAYEEIYDKALERFRVDCEDFGFSWREIQSLPVEEIEDLTLRRTAAVLAVHDHQCQLAREDMQHFEAQLEAIKSVKVEKEAVNKSSSKSVVDETSPQVLADEEVGDEIVEDAQVLADEEVGDEIVEDVENSFVEPEDKSSQGIVDDMDAEIDEEADKSFAGLHVPTFGLWKRQSELPPEIISPPTMDLLTPPTAEFMSADLFEDAAGTPKNG